MPNTATEKDLATMKEDIANLQQDSKTTKEENQARFLGFGARAWQYYHQPSSAINHLPLIQYSNAGAQNI